MFNQKLAIHFSSLLLCLLPLALLSGPFIPDLFLSIITLIFIYISIKNKLWFYYTNKFFYFFSLFYLYIISRSIFSDSIILSLESSLFYFRFFVFSLAVWFLINNNSKLLKYFTVSLVFVFLFALMDGFYQSLYSENLFGITGRLDNRLTLVFSDKMIMGSFIARLFPLLIGLIILNFKSNKYSFLLTFLFLILSDVIIYISGERTAIGLLFLSTVFIIIFVSKLRLTRLITFICALLIIFSITIFNTKVKERSINYTVDQMNIGNEGRVILFSEEHEKIFVTAVDIFKSNPVFGSGPKLFRYYCDKIKKLNEENGCSTHPHNTYLQILAETGIIGLFFILIIVFYLSFKLIKHIKSIYLTPDKRTLSDYQICLFACFMLTLWPFLPTLNFFNNWINIIYFLPVGFYLHSIYESK